MLVILEMIRGEFYMSAMPKVNDATMDDIMASIRRIVGDDVASKPVGFNNEPISPANDTRELKRTSIFEFNLFKSNACMG